MGIRSRLVIALGLAWSGAAVAQPVDPYGSSKPTPAKRPAPKPAPAPPAAPADPYGPSTPIGPVAPPVGPVAPPVGPVAPPIGPAAPVGPAVPVVGPAITPVTPPNPSNPPNPTTPTDPVLAEQIAQSLVGRAQELFDARVYLDAKQLAVEAVVHSPRGPTSDHARLLIKLVNQQLGIREDVPPDPRPAPIDPSRPDPAVAGGPLPPVTPAPEGGAHRDVAATAHGAVFGAVLGTMIGTLVSDDGEKQAGAAITIGAGGALLGALLVPKVFDRLEYGEAQVRTTGSASVWGGVIGAFIGDIGTGLEGTSGRQVVVGAGVGTSLGAVVGAGLASRNKLTRGDVALIDTFAGIGTVGGLTMGLLMQPAESEAYSLNAVLGAAGGLVVGMIAAPQTNTTPRRMLRVAGGAALGGALPFLLYAGISDDTTDSDERVVGLLSSAGLAIGAYLGFRATRGMDHGLDTPSGTPVVDDAPPATITRSSAGRWGFGGLALAPLSKRLASEQRGVGVTLFGAAF